MSPRAFFIGSDRRVSVTLGSAIAVVVAVAGGVGTAYKVRSDLKDEIKQVSTDNATTNAVQDTKIDQGVKDIAEIKADIKELLRRTKP